MTRETPPLCLQVSVFFIVMEAQVSMRGCFGTLKAKVTFKGKIINTHVLAENRICIYYYSNRSLQSIAPANHNDFTCDSGCGGEELPPADTGMGGGALMLTG